MNNPYKPPEATVNDVETIRRDRPWYVSTWLWLAVILYSFSIVEYLFFRNLVPSALREAPKAVVAGLEIVCVVNAMCAVALLKWKRWGIWGFLLTTLASFPVNWWVFGVKDAVLGAAGFPILVVLLNLGGARRVWPQLS